MTTVDPAVKSDSSCVNLTTVLKRIIETASFVIPSPKTKLNSLGFSAGLIKDTAAITSVEHSKEHISKISNVDF